MFGTVDGMVALETDWVTLSTFDSSIVSRNLQTVKIKETIKPVGILITKMC